VALVVNLSWIDPSIRTISKSLEPIQIHSSGLEKAK
jgi:hypothetical protein